MLLEGKNAVVYGGSGEIGSAVARSFAREGATVHLAARTLSSLEAVAAEIAEAGGRALVAELDVLDEAAVNAHAEAVAAEGGIDVALNAVGFAHVQGVPFEELSFEQYWHPIDSYLRAICFTSKAVSSSMRERGSGVILTLSTPGSRMSGPGFLGYGVTCAGVEGFSRILAGELGPAGVRVVCLRPDVIPESLDRSHVGTIFDGIAERNGTTAAEMVAGRAQTGTLLGRFPTLAEVADYAAFAASDRAGAMTGEIANLSCGSLVD